MKIRIPIVFTIGMFLINLIIFFITGEEIIIFIRCFLYPVLGAWGVFLSQPFDKISK